MEVFMNFINAMFGSILSLDPVSAVKMVVMWAIGGTLIYLAIKKDMEPSLLACPWLRRHPCQPAAFRRHRPDA